MAGKIKSIPHQIVLAVDFSYAEIEDDGCSVKSSDIIVPRSSPQCRQRHRPPHKNK